MTTIPNETNEHAAADTPLPADMLTPEQVVDQLRTMRSRIAQVSPLTTEQRRILRLQGKLPEGVLQASINVIGATDAVAQGVEMPLESAQQFADETNHWTAVEAELKQFLGGVADANLIRRKRLGILAAKAYGIARQVARDNPDVRTHVKGIARLRALARGKKKSAAGAPQTPPSPEPAPGTPSPVTSTEMKA